MKYKFNKKYTVAGLIPGVRSIEELEKEQAMYSATPEFCRKHGGPITQEFLDSIPQSYLDEAKERGLYPNIDVRVHRLYPGNFPAYPGWHCDAQFRETFFGQPRVEQTELSDHLIATVSSDEEGISRTEFINRNITLDIDNYDPTEGETFWKIVDQEVNKIKDLPTWLMPDGALTRFDCWTLHRATPAIKRGWRLFLRCAMWYRANLGSGGKLSRQEVIYVDLGKGSGW